MTKHFVQFLSPGTFVSESSELEIEDWNVALAIKMSGDVNERYGAKPYGFRFKTYERTDQELNAKVVKQSGIYFLGGTVRTREQVEKDNKPDEDILRSNMRCNDFKAIIQNDNSWLFTTVLNDNDVVLAKPIWANKVKK